jgi:predicted ATPase/class 3 adenylate cyclase
MRRADLPSGTVTFLFTDVEGSTRLLDELGEAAYAAALLEHRRLVRAACARHGGVEVDTQGDAFFVAFPTAPGALAAASDVQEALAGSRVQLRVGLHTGTPLLTDEGYVGVDLHRAARIAAAGHGGQVLVSASSAALVGRPLVDLGEHRLKDLAAAERIFQLGGMEFPALKSLYRTTCPVPATPFLGREGELASVVRLLGDSTVRLVTLTGPGGTGKTRLALQAAAEASDSYPDGIFWVALASLRDAGLAPGAVGAAVGLREQPGRDAEEALRDLAGRKVMLVLDNAEHLLPDIALTIGRLRDLDGPTVLVTSRERLRLQGEHAWPVPPLTADDGVELFVARASAVDPAFRAVSAVDELCARLDELPLAIELAAARTGVYSVEQLLERIGSRLDMLKGVRDADPRQRTLRATVEWSYGLLDTDEQRALATHSVFVGGWTLEAADKVCDADADVLESLIDKSLLRRRVTSTRPRYWMLETIREFAAERLEASNGVQDLRHRHTAWAAVLADELWDMRRDERQADAFVRFEEEQGNLRAASDYAVAAHEGDEALRIARSAGFFYVRGGRASDAAAELERALELGLDADPVLRIETLRVLVYVSIRLATHDRAVIRAEEAVALARALRDDEALGGALADLGMAQTGLDRRAARRSYEQAIDILRPHGPTPELAGAVHNYGSLLALEREYNAARALYREALEMDLAGASPWGPWGLALVHVNLAGMAWQLGRLDEAFAHAREGAAGMRRLGDPIGLAVSLFYAAAVAAARGDAYRAGVLLAVVDRVHEEASGVDEWLEEMTVEREAILERASPEDRKMLLEGMRAQPAPALEEAVAETFPDL